MPRGCRASRGCWKRNTGRRDLPGRHREPLRSLGRAFFIIDRFVVDGLVWAVSSADARRLRLEAHDAARVFAGLRGRDAVGHRGDLDGDLLEEASTRSQKPVGKRRTAAAIILALASAPGFWSWLLNHARELLLPCSIIPPSGRSSARSAEREDRRLWALLSASRRRRGRRARVPFDWGAGNGRIMYAGGTWR